MSEKRLQIKLLSKSGELLNVVSCYAGQVSVFRATSAADLKPYQRAFAGISGPERFSISIDDKPFVPADHILIGFGERFSSGSEDLAVIDYMIQSGIPASTAESMLVSFDLDRYAKSRCSSLPPNEERLLRLACATYSVDKVLVLNDPFEQLSSQWRERVAELLATFARTKQQIVIIPSLSYRPDYWIDNEHVARIQVGENVQKTIGFGSGATNINTLVNQVRHEFKQKESSSAPASTASMGAVASTQAPQTEVKTPPSSPEIKSSIKPKLQAPPVPTRSLTGLLISGTTLAVIVGVVVGTRLISSRSGQNEIVAKNIPQTESSTSSAEQISSSIAAIPTAPAPSEAPSPPPQVPTEPPAAQVVEPETHTTQVVFLLDEYSPEIKRSVIESFDGSVTSESAGTRPSELKAPRVSAEQTGKIVKPTTRGEHSKAASELLTVLQSASGTGEGLPDQIRAPANPASFNQPDMSNLDPEQRREVIRQKFLEAIQRAAEQRK